MKTQTTRISIFPMACFLLGIAVGFIPGTWKGQLIALQASAPAPGIEPTYISMNSALPVEHPRTKIDTRGMDSRLTPR